MKACYAKNDPNWNCEEFKEHTDMKNLPKGPKAKKNKQDNTEVTDKVAFALSFIAMCGELGLDTPEEITKQAKVSLETFSKTSFELPDVFGAAGKTLGVGADVVRAGALAGAVGFPFMAGAGAGALIGKARNQIDKEDLDVMRREAISRAYQRKLNELKLNMAAHDMENSDPNTYKVIG